MVDNAVPTEQAIAEAAKLEVLDLNGEKVKFGSVFESNKAIVVFIRKLCPFPVICTFVSDPSAGHFFCGVCIMMIH